MRNIPANCSRYFDVESEAINQPIGSMDFRTDSTGSFTENCAYREELIRNDQFYCTSNPFHLRNSITNFRQILKLFLGSVKVIEIGCGQGEFLELIAPEVNKIMGFDPVLKESTEQLINSRFDFRKVPNTQTIFIMRCVLPHINSPFEFLKLLFEEYPNSFVYIEFQDTDYILNNNIWSQISHDHVNYFTTNSFESCFKVIRRGYFEQNEWAYVLLGGIELKSEAEPNHSLEGLQKLNCLPEIVLNQILDESDASYLIYGAAGKGMLIAYELRKLESRVLALDENKRYWGKYLDTSGVRVVSPESGLSDRSKLVIVSNPRHKDFFIQKYGRFKFLDVYPKAISST